MSSLSDLGPIHMMFSALEIPQKNHPDVYHNTAIEIYRVNVVSFGQGLLYFSLLYPVHKVYTFGKQSKCSSREITCAPKISTAPPGIHRDTFVTGGSQKCDVNGAL